MATDHPSITDETPLPTRPVRYTPEVEHLLPNEAELLIQTGERVLGMAQTVRRAHGHAMHATHAKAAGLLKGQLHIAEDLPPELAQGLFARPGCYDVLVRYAPGPSDPVSDKASGQRGMSLKVLGVEGPHLPESRETTTQDWVLALDPAFVASTAEDFLRSFRRVAAKSPGVPESLIVAGSRLARGAEAVLETVGLESSNLRFFGRPPQHPASEIYYSQAPVRYGDYIAKLAIFPTPETLAAIGDPALATSHDDEAARHALQAYYAQHTGTYEVRVQLCTDLQTMPVEDAAVVWSEVQSPYRTVARLVLPPQEAYSEARRQYMDERLAFNPVHALQAHRPLGSIMRVRTKVYLQAQDFRQQANGVVPAEPRSHAEVPD
jgi:hypothetical protein